jgi:hypothetical protein
LLEHNLVDVTPAPIFTGLEGLDDGMIRRVKMLGCMFILRRVTTADMSTDQAFAQVDPRVPDFQAVFTAISAGCNLLDLIKMRTLLCHGFLLSLGLLRAP